MSLVLLCPIGSQVIPPSYCGKGLQGHEYEKVKITGAILEAGYHK